MKKLNRFEIVSILRTIANNFKEVPEERLEVLTSKLVEAVKDTSAMVEVSNELVKCIDTSRLERLADTAKKSFAVRKLFGEDGSSLKTFAKIIDATEQSLDVYYKITSAFAKDKALAKETIRCISRHAGNTVNSVADIMERKDFDNPTSIFNDNDDFAAIREAAKIAYKSEYVRLNGDVSVNNAVAFDILLKAYNFSECYQIGKELLAEAEAEVKAEAEAEVKAERAKVNTYPNMNDEQLVRYAKDKIKESCKKGESEYDTMCLAEDILVASGRFRKRSILVDAIVDAKKELKEEAEAEVKAEAEAEVKAEEAK